MTTKSETPDTVGPWRIYPRDNPHLSPAWIVANDANSARATRSFEFYSKDEAIAVRNALNAVARGTVPGEPDATELAYIDDEGRYAKGHRPRGHASESRSVGASEAALKACIEMFEAWRDGIFKRMGIKWTEEPPAIVAARAALDGVRAGEGEPK